MSSDHGKGTGRWGKEKYLDVSSLGLSVSLFLYPNPLPRFQFPSDGSFHSVTKHLSGWLFGLIVVMPASPEVLLQNLEPNGARGRSGSE